MPWSMKDPPRPAKNWGKKAKKKCVRAANAVLREGGSDQDAIFACIHAAGKTEHPGGEGKGRYGELRAVLTRYLGNQVPMVEVKNMSCCEDCAAKERNMQVSMAALVSAFQTIKSADPATIASLLDDQKLLKAVESLRAQDLKPGEIVNDLWREGEMHRNPPKEEIKTGPSQAMSGGGAEGMVRDYSNTAPQHGIQLQAEQFERMLAPVASAVKAQGETILQMIEKQKGIDAVIAAVLKKAEEEDEEEEDEEESEVVEINASKAKALFAKAKKMLAAIDLLKAEMEEEEEEDDAEKRKARKAKIRDMRKAVARLIAKARLHALAGRKAAADTRKSITELLKLPENRLLKADINVVQEEEEDEEEEEEGDKGKQPVVTATPAAPVADKAKGADAAGNQADRMDPATGNQDDAAKALVAMQARVEESLKGVGLLSADIKSVLDIVRGASKIAMPVPTLAKAEGNEAPKPSTIELIKARIVEMAESGDLNQTNELAAMDIVSNYELVKAGRMQASIVNDRLSRAPTVVQDLFKGHRLELGSAA